MDNRKLKLKAASFDVRCFVTNIKNNSSIIMLLSLFACGLIIGTLSVKNSEYFRYLISIFVADDNEITRIFINSIFFVFLVLTVNFVMGLCLVGSLFITFLSVLEGMIFGSLYAYQLYFYGYEELGRFFASDLLFFVFLYVIFICSQYTSMCMSDSLKQYYCNRKGSVNLRSYLMKTSVFFVSAVLLVIIQLFIKIII